MKTVTTILIFLLLPLLAFNKVSFFQGSLNEAQRAAAIEGKLYFIDFYAAYCLPCKLMDQTTFMDENLANYITGNYVPLKLNVDAFDAYEVRSKHEVRALPTVMIFSSSGQLLESYEGSLTASALYKMLVKHNLPQNRQKTTPPPLDNSNADMANTTTSTRPQRRPRQRTTPQPPKPKPAVTQPKPPKPTVTKPKPSPKPSEVVTTPQPAVTQPASKPVKEVKPEIALNQNESTSTMKPIKAIRKPTANKKVQQKVTTPAVAPKETKPVKPVGNVQNQPKPKVKGLFEFSAKKHPAKGYAVQIGLFAEYSNVLVEVEKIQQFLPDRKVIVHIDEMNGKTVYRVAIGTFDSYAAAKQYLPKIKEAGFDGFIKNLATLK